MKPNQAQLRLSSVGAALFALFGAGGYLVTRVTGNYAPVVAGALLGLYFLFSIRVADQWERVAVLRFGRFTGLRGPGLFHMVPIVDRLSRYVDQRVRVTNVSAESTLTRDTVPVNVDAIVFWVVWNAEKSILEVEDFDAGHHPERADGAARIHRPPRTRTRWSRSARCWATNCSASWTRRPTPGGSPCSRWRFATCRSPPALRRRHVAAGAGRTRAPGPHHPGPGGNRDRREVRAGRPWSTRTIPWRCTCAP